MQNDPIDLAARLRGLIWAAPVIAAFQAGCSQSSCGDFEAQRLEQAVPLTTDDGGTLTPPTTADECMQFCSRAGLGAGSNFACRPGTVDGGPAVICAFNTMCDGRRPAGIAPPAVDERAPLLGRYFAAMAAGEAASVAAFERLIVELGAHGLPPELVLRARLAANDEARHFRVTAALAERFGARAVRNTLSERPAPTLLEIAIENAREGVVRETIGAAFGCWQAEHAADRRMRRSMRRIARDECAHAELSWALDVWLRGRLDAAERARLDAETAAALDSIERELDADVPRELVELAGIPDRRVARALVTEARRELFG